MGDNLNKQQQQEVKKEVDKQVQEIKKDLAQKIEERVTRKILQKSRQTALFFGSEFKKQTATAIIAAFGFIIALVWRDLIVKFIQENINPSLLESYPYLAELFTAIIITFIAAIGIALVTRWQKRENDKQNES